MIGQNWLVNRDLAGNQLFFFYYVIIKCIMKKYYVIWDKWVVLLVLPVSTEELITPALLVIPGNLKKNYAYAFLLGLKQTALLPCFF